jgi:cytochrome c5
MRIHKRITCLFLLLGTGILLFTTEAGCSGDANKGGNASENNANSGKASTGDANGGNDGRTGVSGKVLYEQYCGVCHLKPPPATLTKSVWKGRVLPFMGVMMGISSAIDSFDFSADKDRDILNRPGNYTGRPMMNNTDWSALKDYITSQAPDTLPYDRDRRTRNQPLTQFLRKDFSLDNQRRSLLTGLGYDASRRTLWAGDLYKRIFTWQWDKGVIGTIQAHSPVVDFNFYKGNIYLTEIGMILPTERKIGAYGMVGRDGNSPDGDSVILPNLHRPVQSKIEDLDGDGIPEIVVCNFGNYSGSLSLYKKDTLTGHYAEQVLLPMPGAVKFYIKDMNGDGKKDIVALFAQGDESVYIFYQEDHLQFKAQRVLQYPPNYGTTDMILVDYNHDGLPDIVTVHGDNADYSRILKPYHGIRININQGGKEGGVSFKEKFFYPIYGVTRVVAEDFDKDGDIDFAATAFYADYGNPQDESFVYLENLNSASFRFKSYTLPGHLPVKSFAMEKADIDGDGYMDIILGNFSQSPVAVPDSLEAAWQAAPYGLTVFLNQSGHHHRLEQTHRK